MSEWTWSVHAREDLGSTRHGWETPVSATRAAQPQHRAVPLHPVPCTPSPVPGTPSAVRYLPTTCQALPAPCRAPPPRARHSQHGAIPPNPVPGTPRPRAVRLHGPIRTPGAWFAFSVLEVDSEIGDGAFRDLGRGAMLYILRPERMTGILTRTHGTGPDTSTVQFRPSCKCVINRVFTL